MILMVWQGRFESESSLMASLFLAEEEVEQRLEGRARHEERNEPCLK